MVASPDDPYSSNPYMAPEMQEQAQLDRMANALGSVWKWLALVVVIEAAVTVAMTTFHEFSPQVAGINLFAVGNLVLSGVMAITFAWLMGRRRSGTRGILITQLANLLIWVTFTTIIYLCFGIAATGEGSILLTSFVASAVLSLISVLASHGLFRSRSA